MQQYNMKAHVQRTHTHISYLMHYTYEASTTFHKSLQSPCQHCILLAVLQWNSKILVWLVIPNRFRTGDGMKVTLSTFNIKIRYWNRTSALASYPMKQNKRPCLISNETEQAPHASYQMKQNKRHMPHIYWNRTSATCLISTETE